MHKDVQPDEAARALTEIGRRQEQVINLAIIPTWFWWAIAVLMVGLAAAVDSHRPVAIGVGTSLFVIGVLAVTGWVVINSARQAQLRNELLGPGGVLAILGFVAIVIGVSLPTAFALQAAGVRYPATVGMLVAAALMVIGGPLLTRHLRRIMLSHRTGSQR